MSKNLLFSEYVKASLNVAKRLFSGNTGQPPLIPPYAEGEFTPRDFSAFGSKNPSITSGNLIHPKETWFPGTTSELPTGTVLKDSNKGWMSVTQPFSTSTPSGQHKAPFSTQFNRMSNPLSSWQELKIETFGLGWNIALLTIFLGIIERNQGRSTLPDDRGDVGQWQKKAIQPKNSDQTKNL